jgi:hypothetical protein
MPSSCRPGYQRARLGFMDRLQMIDASIVQAPKQSINKEEKAIVA